MTKKIENFRVHIRDWKERLGSKELIKKLKQVEKAAGEEAQVSEDVCATEDDSIVTCIWPVSIDIAPRSISGDVCDVFGWCDKIHIDKEGKLWFRFEEQYGLKTDKWLSQEDAVVWIEGLGCADELQHDGVHATELASFKRAVAKAKALA